MYSSVMNAVIKLLLSQGNKINCLKGEGERLPEKVNTDLLAHVLSFHGSKIIRLREVAFVTCQVFGIFLK